MDNLSNNMSMQVFSIPDLIRKQYEDLENKTRTILSFQEIFNIQKIILTGCGDSYAAALATQNVFSDLVGVPTEVVKAIDLARFYPEKELGVACQNPLIITVSNSGTGARINEAISRAKKCGAFVLSVTGNMESNLAKIANKTLNLEIEKFPSAPGVRSYVVSLISLILLAIRFGEVRANYTMDQAMDYRKDLLNQADNLENSLEEINKICLDIARKYQNIECFDFVGAGNDYASSWYGHAKVLEAVGKYSMHINSEEWFHLNFFARNTHNILTVINASKNNKAMSRNIELIKFAKILERPVILISDAEKEELTKENVIFIKLPSQKYYFNNVLLSFVPSALILAYISKLIGEEYGRGVKGLWDFAKDGAGVINSEIILI